MIMYQVADVKSFRKEMLEDFFSLYCVNRIRIINNL